MFLFLTCLLCGSLAGERAGIIVDGVFDDWGAVPVAYSDTAGEGSAGGVDFGRLWLADDERYFFLLLEVGLEVDPSENNRLRLFLDTDNNANTGLPVGGMGAELEWRMGERAGTFRLSGEPDRAINYVAIRFRQAPTVDGSVLEMAIGRDALPDGENPLFMGSKVGVVIDDGEGGDILPNEGEAVLYKMNEGPLPDDIPIPLERERSSDLRLTTYNVLFNGLFNTALQPAFERQITAVAPDILNFQENFSGIQATVDLVSRILPLTGGEEWFGAGNTDVVTVSRYPILDSWALFDRSSTGNLALLLDTESALGSNLLLINAHAPCCGNETGRQREIDQIMAFIRDAKNPGEPLDLAVDTPIIITGDMNLVGRSQQLRTFLTGDIVNESVFGADFSPDWDGGDFTDLISRHTDQRMGYTWRSDAEANFWPGHLDYIIYSGSVLERENHFILYTPAMSPDRLDQYGLKSGDSLVSDHIFTSADFRPVAGNSLNPWVNIPAEEGFKGTEIGVLNDSNYPFIYHLDHGWLYVSMAENGLWLYDFSGHFGWVFTKSEVYPFLYAEGMQSWLWFFEGTDRWFHRFRDGENLFSPLSEE